MHSPTDWVTFTKCALGDNSSATFDLTPQKHLATLGSEDVDGRVGPGQQVLISARYAL